MDILTAKDFRDLADGLDAQNQAAEDLAVLFSAARYFSGTTGRVNKDDVLRLIQCEIDVWSSKKKSAETETIRDWSSVVVGVCTSILLDVEWMPTLKSSRSQ